MRFISARVERPNVKAQRRGEAPFAGAFELSRFAAGSATLLLRATPGLDKASPMSHHPASLQPALRRAYFVQALEFQRIKKQKAREHFFAVHRARSTPNSIEAPCGQRL